VSEPVIGPFDAKPTGGRPWAIPAASVMAGSAATLIPVIFTFPIMPPFGLIILLGWRLTRPDSLPVWVPLLLGLFDDLISGQPFGSAMLLWTVSFLVIDLLDQRLVWHDFWQDWLLAAGGIASCLILGRLIASPIGAHVDTVLLLQVIVSIMLYPVMTRLIAWLDRKRIAP
jgi:rod shape-determining protein MreD